MAGLIFFIILFCCAPAYKAYAHGSLHEAIERKSVHIAENPGDALLLFERGLLYQEHKEAGKALADFHKALQLEPAYYICHLPLSELYLEKGLVRKALFHVNTLLSFEPGNPFAYETRASAYQMMGQDALAVADLRKAVALKNADAIRPEDYFRLSGSILKASPGNYDEAIAALEEGLQRLGNIISIQSRIVSLEIESHRCGEAVKRIDQIMAPLARKEKWLAQKAQILEMDGKPEEAYAAYRQAGAEAQALKSRRGNTTAPTPAASGQAGTADNPAAQSNAMLGITRGPYLQSGTPQSMVVKWRTDIFTDTKIWYGPDTSSLIQTVAVGGTRKDHEITISGLVPNTRYYYAIGHSGGILGGGTAEHFFQTSPPAGATQAVRAWVLGDSGTSDNKARAVRDGYYAYAGDHFTDLILMLGDNAYEDGKDSEYQTAVFENMYEEQLIHSVLWATPGNHDYASANAANQTGPYFNIFTFPRNGEAGGLASGTEAYYSFDYANIHFVSLDSHDSGRAPGDPMLVWLENDLNATLQDWIVVIFHHPPYSKGSHDSDDDGRQTEMRENVLPILEAAGVDLVLSGHSHSYERSFLLNGHYGLSNTLLPTMILDNSLGRIDDGGAYHKDAFGPEADKGAVYAVAGSSGKISNAPLNHPVMVYNALTLGSLSLEITDKQLDLKFIGTAGEVMDYFTLQKYLPIGNPPAVRVSSPTNGAFFDSLQAISLQVLASDIDGSVEEVTFFVDGDSIGVDSTTPYSIDWAPTLEGDYYIKARAIDNDGNPANSAIAKIRVGSFQTCSKVRNTNDDAEEHTSGQIELASSDLELVDDPGRDLQTVGLRFRNLNLPPGAIITSAHIQFTADETRNVNPCNLAIFGEASDDAAAFSSADYNITSRPRTAATIPWAPTDWLAIGDAGAAQRTPDIAPLIQEIVNRPGYTSSSSVAILIDGVGGRTAESFNGVQAKAPELCIEYHPAPPAYDCPTYSANIGEACNDGNNATINDTLDANCNCAGTISPCTGIGDNDGDGICANVDCDDDDPNTATQPGQACDDGDTNTINDTIDANCNCAGTPTACTGIGDADNDGLCSDVDCDDNDPNISTQPGQACDDSNNNTIDDTIDGNCNCIGTPITCTGIGDADGDGVCANVDCDDNDPNVSTQPGQACDDGDNTTVNDVLDANCNCAGTSTACTGIGDADGDGICADVDCDDDDPSTTAQPGQACDDGDNTTVNDAIEGNCNCAGTPTACTGIGDADGDGICADVDCDDDNPNISTQPGQACDDGDNTTVNDVMDANCNCAGTPTACTGIGDADGDGICADVDCDDNDPSTIAQPGQACDDGDNTTLDDTIDGNCNCAGTPTACTGIGDADGDGICANVDCDDNDPSVTTRPGDTCNDGNPNTYGEIIQLDCNCSGGVTPTISCGSINSSSDCAEEDASGAMDLNSSDLELAFDPGRGQQTVGLRFTGLGIPKGAAITGAYLQFTVDETRNMNPCNLMIHCQASDDAPTFSASNQNISSRPRGNVAVAWSPQEWLAVGAAGPGQQTPDISAIIQEIVNREGYTSASSMVLIIDGEGGRTAESFDGVASMAPKLCVEYYVSPPPFDCPVLLAHFGDPCNDGDNTTINDAIDSNCNCTGTPTACTGFGDADGDGVCADADCDDNDPDITDQAGNACDDGDNTTLDDTIDSNCNCTGTPTACTGIGDADGDGVCADVDCDDNDPNNTDQPGNACDDGDNTTLNDAIEYTIDDNCHCAGTPTACTGTGDADGDGVCTDVDCDDNDPNNTSQPGDTCNDGDNTTLNDAIDGNCNCIGIPTACTGFGDNDGDGICADSDCDDNDPNATTQPGDACNDGDNTTLNDAIDANCNCAGIPTACTGIGDNDGDGICADVDCDDNDANITTQPGQACDDGDNTTVNDILDANCHCAGTPTACTGIGDADGDGVCADVDCNDNNPNITAQPGQACNDGDNTTLNDIINANCSCAGTPTACTGIGDNDGDGVCADVDCDDNDPAVTTRPGDACNDGDNTTLNDIITASCNCVGAPTACTGIGDADGDGICADVDCDDNNPNITTRPGQACNDGNPNTYGETIQADCNCGGGITPATACSRINSSSDCAEERLAGSVDLTSTDLELVEDPITGIQTVGLRFNGLNIPQGAVITSAYIQFTTDQINNLSPCNLTVYGQASDNAATFTNSLRNVSSRTRTNTSVAWSPTDWLVAGAAGTAQRTPNISAILQEIVNRSGYSSGSSVVFTISGRGRRTAESFDGVPAHAPELCVTYLPAPPAYDCPSLSANVGDACNDGDPTTLNDAIGSNCNCTGTPTACTGFGDNDGDGVCADVDCNDSDPNITAQPGDACDDGDNTTLNDIITANCNCLGNPTACTGTGDADGDGICADVDCNDNNPAITTRPGDACNDGDNTTINDIITADCNCAGTPTACTGTGDADGDGVCADVDCNDNNPAITTQPGQACNDGDNTTINDIITADCNCAGTPTACTGAGDNDGDGVCADVDCNDNNPGITTQPGQACNDGDNTTLNDIIDANCNCAGTPTACTGTGDNDGDGVCADVDCNDNNPTITTRPGDACNDGDNTTLNDIIDANCNCAGTPTACTGTGDADGDGVCADVDCDDNNPGITTQPGQACNDGDDTTINDIITANCNCAGTPTACTGTGDADGDGVCADVDCDDNNPAITTQPGQACNDGDDTTLNDAIDANCNCAGTPTACTGAGDADGDGVCADVDCDDNSPAITTQPGQTCDDGNPATYGETIQSDCSCGGGLTSVMICSRVNNSSDCAEEQVSGTMDMNSSDLELMDEPIAGLQTVGLRFNGLNIPQGAVITSAHIQFTVDETRNLNPCNLTVFGQASDNAATFTNSLMNITNRPRTNAAVAWSPPDWMPVGAAGAAQRTPDISIILQEIVNRSGYTPNSSIALIIDGIGRRTAESFSGAPAQAPELCVEYLPAPPPLDCPALSANIGDACNDGDNTTINDVVDANCNCAGTPTACTGIGDNDGDGVCADVDCDDNNPAVSTQPGNACNDGDNTTINDVVDANCNCAGTPTACTGTGDADGDGICADVDCDDNNPAVSTQPGDACDDGDNTTINDVVDANCNCAGMPTACTGIGDADGDGVCADVDCDDSDPAVTTQPGQACNDGNPATLDDTIDGNCDCRGISTACPGLGDADGDGVCADVDCDDNDPGITTQPGDACDDGDPTTIGESIQADCNCGGGASPSITCSRISSNGDDAEERSTGFVDLTSSDLELVDDPTQGIQTAGLRFNNLNIPQGAVITGAFVQFAADENRNVNPCNLEIYGQASDNAGAFTTAAYNISSRPRTSASVAWSPPDWLTVGEVGAGQLTPDISSIIQEIVNRSGYAGNGSIVLIIEGTGGRTAESHNGFPTWAPELCVEYYVGPPLYDCPALSANTGDACDDGDDTTINDMVGANCNCTGTPTACTGIGDNDGDGTCADVDCDDNDPNITALDADGDGVCGDMDCDDDNPAITTQPGDACNDGNPATIGESIQADCSCGGGTAALPTTACARVAGSSDDAEERASGIVDLVSSDLELTFDPNLGNQFVGMRFNNLNIPQDAFITNAYIQFTVDEAVNNNPCSLGIYGQASGHAASFIASNNDISSRPRTNAVVNWAPADWQGVGSAGAAQRTPDLSAIIQEIIGQSGYGAGSSIAIIINGTGGRTAEAFEGSPAGAPELCVEYVPDFEAQRQDPPSVKNAAEVPDGLSSTPKTSLEKAGLPPGRIAIGPLSIYPNPSRDKLFVSFSSEVEGQALVQARGLSGNVVLMESMEINQGENTVTLDGLPLPNGMYILQLVVGSSVQSARFVILRD